MLKKTASVLLTLVVLFPLTGCAVKQARTPYIKDDEEFGKTGGLFRARWWNYYERGMSFADGGFNDEALEDFKRAIVGRNSDQWRARTYGMHFVNYFPHRELGIVYYRQRKVEAAIRELEISLKTAESAKAKFFLNKARKLDLEASGKDLMPPIIRFSDNQDDEFITNRLAVNVEGTVTDDSFVSSMQINGNPFHLELSVPFFNFSREIRLKEGINKISVTADDLLGRTTRKELKVRADWRGPLISLRVIRSNNVPGGGPTRVIGVVTDKSGIVSLVVNGREIASDQEDELVFEHGLNIGYLSIKAVDIAGNVTLASYPRVKKASLRSRGPRFASAANLLVPSRQPIPVQLSEGPRETNGHIFETAASGRGRPNIHIENYEKDMAVYGDSILLEGSVSDDEELVSLKINGEQVLKRRGIALYFSRLLPLEVGENLVMVEAANASGGRSVRRIEIMRKIQQVRQIGSRMSIAVLPMEKRGEPSAVSEAVYGSLVSALVSQARFNVVERERLDELLRELKLSSTELVTPATASRLGRIVSADSMLAGSIMENKEAIEIVAELIDSETSEVISSEDVFDEDKSLRSVANLLERLAWKFKNDFPLLEGKVIDLEGRKKLLVDMGQETRIRKHCRLILFRDYRGSGNPGHDKSAGTSEANQLGEARITAVFDEYSRARLVSGSGQIKILDRAITK